MLSRSGVLVLLCCVLTLVNISGVQSGPDLVLDVPALKNSLMITHKFFSASSCEYDHGCVSELGERRLLRFDTRTGNIGDEDLIVGQPDFSNPRFVWDPCHAHFHFNGYANYEVLDEDLNPISLGLKQAFCLMDTSPYEDYDGTPAPEAEYSCSYQGISRGWADTYGKYLDCQFIDITGVPAGVYFLNVSINSERGLYEDNYENNVQLIEILIPPDGGSAQGVYVYEDISHSWKNPRTSGHTLWESPGDDEGLKVQLDIPFHYFFQDRSEVIIHTNGFLHFVESTGSHHVNEEALENAILVLWDDWIPTAESIYYTHTSNSFVVTWMDMAAYGDATANAAFQVEIYDNDLIEMRYKDVSYDSVPNGASATVAVCGDNILQCTTYSFDSDSVQPNSALRWTPDEDAQNVPPVAENDGPFRGYVGQSVRMDGSGSYDPDGSTLIHTWTFGDGHPPVFGRVVTHTYSSEGTYTVRHKVFDGYYDSPEITTTARIIPEGGTFDDDDDNDNSDNGEKNSSRGRCIPYWLQTAADTLHV